MKSAVSEVTPEDLKSFPLNRRESLNPGNQKKAGESDMPSSANTYIQSFSNFSQIY